VRREHGEASDTGGKRWHGRNGPSPQSSPRARGEGYPAGAEHGRGRLAHSAIGKRNSLACLFVVAAPALQRNEADTMSTNQVSDILAKAFAAEGVDTLFTLMGDANMYWSASMADNERVRLIHARHEHCCVAMADAYARATRKVGVASVTCGPGYTQIMTALVMAARGNAPVVVFAGDAPIGASWYIQSIDQAPLALATGAAFVPIRTIDRALDCVREAFY